MKRYINVLLLFIVLGITCMISNVSAAVVELKAGTYTSSDGHTIVVNADKTVSYESTYALTLNEKDRGSTISGKVGTNNASISLYQLNDSNLITGGAISYVYGGSTVYLKDFTVFHYASTPVEKTDGPVELYHNNSKVNSYADIQSAVNAANDGDIIKLTKNINVTSGVYIN